MSEDGDGPRNNAGNTPRGRPFQPGNAGRPRGARNKATLLAQQLIDDQGEQVIQAMVAAAVDGDVQAGRLIVERLLPPRKSRPVELSDMPGIEGANDVARAQAELLRAVAAGEIAPDEASHISAVIDANRRAVETSELLARLEALEQAAQKAKAGGRGR